MIQGNVNGMTTRAAGRESAAVRGVEKQGHFGKGTLAALGSDKVEVFLGSPAVRADSCPSPSAVVGADLKLLHSQSVSALRTAPKSGDCECHRVDCGEHII